MSKFKVGDRVIIKKPKDTGAFPFWNSESMDIFDGNTVSISFVKEVGAATVFMSHETGDWEFSSDWADGVDASTHYAKDATELTGGRVNYYLVRVKHPQREDQPAYTAECEDIISALNMTFDEANIFKEIWRSANARKGNGKPDHKALYGAQKMVHYSERNLRRIDREGSA